MTKRLLLLLVSLGFFGLTFADQEVDEAADSVVEQVETGDDEDEAEPEEVVLQSYPREPLIKFVI